MSTFWVIITALGLVATAINMGWAVAAMRQGNSTAVLVRGLAGLVSLCLSVGIVLGKLVLAIHDPFKLTQQDVFAATGVAIFALLFLPSLVERNSGGERKERVTMQQRALRPTNATIRLEKRGGDEWVN